MDPLARFIFGLPSIVIALTVHEFFHAYSAWRCGDPTAKYENRVTLNPLAHFEPVGGILLIVSLLISPFVVGWGKPVPVNENYMGSPRRDGLIVASAGIVSNVCLAAIAGMLLKLGILDQASVPGLFVDYFVRVNLGLGLFNLLPVPPLDGWKILQGILPADLGYKLKQVERGNPMIIYIILAVVVLSPLTSIILGIPYDILYRLFTQ